MNPLKDAAVVFNVNEIDENALRKLVLHLCEAALVMSVCDNVFVDRLKQLSKGLPADAIEQFTQLVDQWSGVKNSVVAESADRFRSIAGNAAKLQAPRQ